ncbi:MAG: hypothetical protein LBF49_01645 [Puniceicoccales bacterium]|nr:hypothetical protein [Puniceicoccales bacterium]
MGSPFVCPAMVPRTKISPSGIPDPGHATSPATLDKNGTGVACGNGYYVKI